jgi:hypothetical protein
MAAASATSQKATPSGGSAAAVMGATAQHDFGSGTEIGSVSAASPALSANKGKQFKRVGDTLTIG